MLEARARLGGRATAFADRETGELVDNGQHVLLGCYQETFAFLRDVGAEANVRAQSDLAVTMIDRAGVRSRLRCPTLPSPWHLVAGVLGWSALSWRDRLSVLRLPRLTSGTGVVSGSSRTGSDVVSGPHVVSGFSRTSSDLTRTTVDDWLIQHRQTPRIREMLWEPLALAALNQPTSVAAAAPFVRVLSEMFAGGRSASALVLPTVPLHLMYAEPARLFIERRGGSVRTAAAARVFVEGGKAVRVEAAGERFAAPAVICACPWFALPDVLIGEVEPVRTMLDAARQTRPSPIVTVNLWFDRVVMDEPFVGLPGRVMQWVFDKRAVFGESASHLSLVSSGADDVLRWSNPQLIEAALDELRGALPRVAGATVVRATVIREPRATFSLEPGQPARPSTRTPIGGLFLAGDWIDTGLPATIEGAVRSGHVAAEAARSSCDR